MAYFLIALVIVSQLYISVFDERLILNEGTQTRREINEKWAEITSGSGCVKQIEILNKRVSTLEE